MSVEPVNSTEERSGEALREEQAILRTFQKHPGWKLIERCALFQQGNYQREALKPIQSMDHVPGNEFTKGVAQGITEVLSLPAQLLEEIELELAARASRRPLNEGAENGGRDDDVE